MKKDSVDSLVSLIIEQINEWGNDSFPSDQFTFIDSLEKYEDVFFGQDQEQPAEVGAEVGAEVPAEVDEMAQPSKHPIEKLPEPLRIPVNMLTKGGKTPYIPKIVTLDPLTNEMVEGMIISDEYHTMPNGDRVLRFYNYGEEPKVDRAKRRLRYVVLPENRYLSDLPRSSAMGTKYVRPDYETTPANETEEDKEKRLARIAAIKEANAKRYGIFPIVNDVFSRHDVLDRLDICLIPETWATTKRTEHTTNVTKLKKFGGTSPEIDADFYAVRDILNVDEAINSVMDLRADLAMGAMGDEEQAFDINRPRETSSAVPRRHANYIYTKGGNWSGKQRVHDPEFFKKAGGKTMVYHLNSKNIQEGLKELNVESVLHLRGFIDNDINGGDQYILKATFTSTLNARNLTSGAGENRGSLIDPIIVSLIKPLPKDFDVDTFTLDANPEFFVNEGKARGGKKTGFLPSLISRLGDAIMANVDPDDVQQRIVQLAQEAVEENA
jgi:hypothetical protein